MRYPLIFLLATCCYGARTTNMQVGLDADGYWHFNEATGSTVYDSSDGGGTGSITDATWSTVGLLGGALDFDGGDDLVVIPDSIALQPTTELTMTWWVRPTDCAGVGATTWGRLVAKWDGSSNGTDDGAIMFDTYSSNNDNCGIRSGMCDSGDTFHYATGTPDALTAGEWNFVVAKFENSVMTMYVNLVAQNTNDLGEATIPDGSWDWKIGEDKEGAGDNAFYGLIDEVRIYTRALSAAELEYLYRAQSEVYQ